MGNHSLAECRRALTPTGTLVLSGGGVSGGGSFFGPMGLMISGQLFARFVSQRVVVLGTAANGEILAALRELAEAGTLKPVIDRTFPLVETAAAVHYLEIEHARAKVVVTV